MTDDPEIIVAALLHDTIEDAGGVSAEEIAAEFGPRVALLVQAVSEENGSRCPPKKLGASARRKQLLPCTGRRIGR